MNRCFTFSLAPLAALLLAGSALAQTDSSRADRNCTRSTLSTNPTAPCADDVLIDSRPDFIILTRPPPPISAGGSLTTGPGTAIQPGADVTGVGPGAPANTSGATSTGGAAGMTGRR